MTVPTYVYCKQSGILNNIQQPVKMALACDAVRLVLLLGVLEANGSRTERAPGRGNSVVLSAPVLAVRKGEKSAAVCCETT